MQGLVDSGYAKEAHLMCPKAWPLFLKDVKWSEWLESCRKDVECTFGILKAKDTRKTPAQRIAE